MSKLQEKLKEISLKYKLNLENFKVFQKKKLINKEVIIYYGKNEFFFKTRDFINLKSNFFFPYFKNENKSSLDDWASSIKATLLRKKQLLSSIEDGKELRDIFKKKNNV